MKTIDFKGANAQIAGTTPALVDKNSGLVTTCWELSSEEVMKIIENKKVYLTVNTNGQKEYQPSLLHVDHPDTVSENG